MKNPFKAEQPALDPKRNAFDLTHSNNLTLKIGKLTPVMCQEVIPGDSFEIDANFGLRFMPTYFPVQNRIRADLHFFYVRNRNLWKNWKKFIGGTESTTPVVSPYIAAKTPETGFYEKGSLADYLGIPVATTAPSTSVANPVESVIAPRNSSGLNLHAGNSNPAAFYSSYFSVPSALYTYITNPNIRYVRDNNGGEIPLYDAIFCNDTTYVDKKDAITLISSNPIVGRLPLGLTITIDIGDFSPNEGSVRLVFFYKNAIIGNTSHFQVCAFSDPCAVGEGKIKMPRQVHTAHGIRSLDINTDNSFWTNSPNRNLYLGIMINNYPNTFYNLYHQRTFSNVPTEKFVSLDPQYYSIRYQEAALPVDATAGYDVYNPVNLPISALPFRAYESIFNAFYRNERVDPLIKNGNPVYDEFVTTDADGADATPYDLFDRYWEKDFLTTCVPSPQQGAAPLVGVTENRPYTVQKMNIGGTDQNVQVKVGDDNQVIGISYYDEKIPLGSVEALESAIKFGISINDFRNVNALQRWLEINQRRGYLYKDQLLSHYGVNVKFEEMNMPEFIGGVSQNIDTSAVYSSASTDGAALGGYAGAASCFGKGENKIRKYCDEHGFIIAILSISPIPTYSQVMPKFFIKNNKLDYFFPEFGHIGYQPITYKEITPLQAYAEGGTTSLNTVFGYNRAYYDYVGAFDTVHGDFRTSLQNFLISRQFGTKPLLSKQFLSIRENEVNNIFNYTGNTDKVVGQVNFHIIAKRPIPFFSIPKID